MKIQRQIIDFANNTWKSDQKPKILLVTYENPLKSVQKMDEISCESSEEESIHISNFSSKNCKIVGKDQESFQERSDECFEQSPEKVEISSFDKSSTSQIDHHYQINES